MFIKSDLFHLCNMFLHIKALTDDEEYVNI